MLKVTDLTVHYGAIQALRGISFDVNEGEIITLIGSNGAGKTTTLHSVSNIIKKTSGKVEFLGNDINSSSRRKTSFCKYERKRKSWNGCLYS